MKRFSVDSSTEKKKVHKNTRSSFATSLKTSETVPTLFTMNKFPVSPLRKSVINPERMSSEEDFLMSVIQDFDCPQEKGKNISQEMSQESYSIKENSSGSFDHQYVYSEINNHSSNIQEETLCNKFKDLNEKLK